MEVDTLRCDGSSRQDAPTSVVLEVLCEETSRKINGSGDQDSDTVMVETRLSGKQVDKVYKEIDFDGMVKAEAVATDLESIATGDIPKEEYGKTIAVLEWKQLEDEFATLLPQEAFLLIAQHKLMNEEQADNFYWNENDLR
ncbi:LOW QUALITY PROTEIN: hypothetical protein V2J09_011178 [Rumex salicifolius]